MANQSTGDATTTGDAMTVGDPMTSGDKMVTTLTAAQRNLALLASALVVADIAVVVSLRPAPQHGLILAGALLFDIALFVGGALLYLRHKRVDLTTLVQLPRVVRGTLVGLALCTVAARLAGMPITGWVLLPAALVETLVGLLVWRTLWRSWRTASNEEFWTRLEGALLEQLPAPLAHGALGELRILVGAARAVTFRPLRKTEGGFTSTASTSYGSLVIGLVFATAAEMAAVQLGLAYYFGSAHPSVHVVVIAIHLYFVAWLLGDWRVMREMNHTITSEQLHIALGLRWQATIPLAAIERVELGEVETPNALLGEKRPDYVAAVTPMEAPNLTIYLKAPVELRTYFGFRRTATEVQLYVDDAAAFADALRSSSE